MDWSVILPTSGAAGRCMAMSVAPVDGPVMVVLLLVAVDIRYGK
jgi:hypothetical protein